MFRSTKLWQWILVLCLIAAMTAAFRAAVESDASGAWPPSTITFLIVCGAVAGIALFARAIPAVIQWIRDQREWYAPGELFPTPWASDSRLVRLWYRLTDKK